MEIRAFATPDTLRGGDLKGCAAVVIDALRMTSVAAQAMANGCAGIFAVAEVDEARALARECGALLGGERQALKIEGFDFSNSPLEYTRERIGGHKLIMTTSNGTRAILAAGEADRLLLGAFVNRAAVVEAVRDADRLGIVCAGTLGAFTLEDALAAGAIIRRLLDRGIHAQLDDMAQAVLTLYESARGDLHKALSGTRHYRRLTQLGFSADLDFCLSEDNLSSVPERGRDGWFA